MSGVLVTLPLTSGIVDAGVAAATCTDVGHVCSQPQWRHGCQQSRVSPVASDDTVDGRPRGACKCVSGCAHTKSDILSVLFPLLLALPFPPQARSLPLHHYHAVTHPKMLWHWLLTAGTHLSWLQVEAAVGKITVSQWQPRMYLRSYIELVRSELEVGDAASQMHCVILDLPSHPCTLYIQAQVRARILVFVSPVTLVCVFGFPTGPQPAVSCSLWNGPQPLPCGADMSRPFWHCLAGALTRLSSETMYTQRS